MNGNLDTHLARAIRKYGSNNFKLSLICNCKSQKELCEQEQYWIRYYNSVQEGYNETDAICKCGGNTYQSKTPEEIHEMRENSRKKPIWIINPEKAFLEDSSCGTI